MRKPGIASVLLIGSCFLLYGCAPSREAETPAPLPKQEAMPAAKNPDGSFKPFTVYSDANAPDNHFDPSGWMGDYGDIQMTQEHLDNPHGGSTCIEVKYNAQKSHGAGWAGVYWQNPSNNWGTRPGGFDLTGAKKVTFWARGAKGGERIEEIKIGGIAGDYPDSDTAGIGPLLLETEWRPYTLDIEGKDLSSISGGFCWVAAAEANPEGITFYLDDIRYE